MCFWFVALRVRLICMVCYLIWVWFGFVDFIVLWFCLWFLGLIWIDYLCLFLLWVGLLVFWFLGVWICRWCIWLFGFVWIVSVQLRFLWILLGLIWFAFLWFVCDLLLIVYELRWLFWGYIVVILLWVYVVLGFGFWDCWGWSNTVFLVLVVGLLLAAWLLMFCSWIEFGWFVWFCLCDLSCILGFRFVYYSFWVVLMELEVYLVLCYEQVLNFRLV